MTHLVLLGDSVLDNASYTAGGPCVIDQVREILPSGWQATLCAVDGSITDDVAEQMERLPPDATHLYLCVGGNNALMRSDLLDTPVTSTGEALLLLYEAAQDFEASYRKMLAPCLQLSLPIVVSTIYYGNFPEEDYQHRVVAALASFNDVIIRVAAEKHLKIVDIRAICHLPEDFANPIEPSSIGGEKIAGAIVKAVTDPAIHWSGALLTSS